jgi:uncharacterized protein
VTNGNNKVYLSYQDIHVAVKRCAEKIQASSFMPDLILAIGAGGLIPARILRTFIHKPILTVTIASYDDDDQLNNYPRKAQWLDEEHTDLSGQRILLVDEVDDTRTTLEFCLTELLKHRPKELAVFVVHNKLKPKRGRYPDAIKHVFVGETLQDQWICYPWDATDIIAHEQCAHQAMYPRQKEAIG